jgi:hypothetical protein
MDPTLPYLNVLKAAPFPTALLILSKCLQLQKLEYPWFQPLDLFSFLTILSTLVILSDFDGFDTF